jgi:hypothetical protein
MGRESRAGEPDASLDTQGISLHCACCQSYVTASLHAKGRIGPFIPEPCALIGHPLGLLNKRR